MESVGEAAHLTLQCLEKEEYLLFHLETFFFFLEKRGRTLKPYSEVFNNLAVRETGLGLLPHGRADIPSLPVYQQYRKDLHGQLAPYNDPKNLQC